MEKRANSQSKIRLNRYLAMCGIGSRRKCDEYIANGEVRVNGETVTQMGVRVNPDEQVVEFRGMQVKGEEESVYILMNKPLRTLTTASDQKKRKTVLDIVDIDERIFPVGRLDYNTTGALLLTNDGDISYFLAHPKFEVSKKYRVLLDRKIRPIDLYHFRRGIELDGKKTASCRIDELRIIDNASYLEVELHEGRNRQIRRMFEALGYRVRELHRIEFAGLRVNNMKEGQWRKLSVAEVRRLKEIVRQFKSEVVQKQDAPR